MAHWETVKTAVIAAKIGWIHEGDDLAALITEYTVDEADRILANEITYSTVSDYLAGSLSEWDTKTLLLAEINLVVYLIYLHDHEVVKKFVKPSKPNQYGQSDVAPATTEDIVAMANEFLNKAKNLCRQYLNPSSPVNAGVTFKVAQAPVWGSGDEWT